MALSAKATREITSQIDSLVFKRDSCYEQVDSLYTLSLNLTLESSDLDDFKCRMEKLEVNYVTFNKCNVEIVKLRSMLNNEEKASDLIAIKSLTTDMDTRYFYLLAAQKRFCPDIGLVSKSPKRSNDTSKQPQDALVRLPPIEIPYFDGTLRDWPAFKDCYESLIHNNNSLSDVHKFQYLISSTKGEVNSLVRTLPLTDGNYSIIWKKLLSRFDNKRVLAAHYIDEIVNFEHLTHESPSKLRLLIDTLSDNMSAVERLDLPDNLSNFIIFHLVLKKLDKHTRQLFEEGNSQTEFPTLKELKVFLQGHCKAVEAAQNNDNKFVSNKSQFKPNFKTASKSPHPSGTYPPQARLGYNSSPKPFVSNAALVPSNCLYCSETHMLSRCPVFNNLTPLQRKDFARSKRICFNCLGYFHMLTQCTSKSVCRNCGMRHHTLLHIDPKPNAHEAGLPNSTAANNSNRPDRPTSTLTNKPTSNSKVDTDQNKPVADERTALSASVNVHHANNNTNTITVLGTIKMKVQDSSGEYSHVRALVDPGSQLSFITEACVKTLGLNRHKYSSPIMGLSQTPVNNTKGLVNCQIKPKYDGQNLIHAKAVILDKITSPLPTCVIDSSVKQSFHHLNLADDDFDKPGPIDFLLGADLYPLVFDGGRISAPPGHPTPFHSVFGWVLIGESKINLEQMCSSSNLSLTCNLCISDKPTLDLQLKRFWEIEEMPTKQTFVSDDDRYCEAHFVETHSRDPVSKRYIVKLPFQDETPCLGSSFENAKSRLCSLEMRLGKNPNLKTSYCEFMQEYLHLGHMRPLNSNDEDPKYFIPHHGIFKNSTSTKFRTVFDASATSSNGKSLNNLLFPGPKLQRDIAEIICNFRCHKIAFVADITKMYRQILVHPDHQPYQTILWRESPSAPIDQFVLQTVTYGVSSAPFLAMRTIHQLVTDEGTKFPAAIKPIMQDMFVDDLLTGGPSLKSALEIKNDVIGLLNSGGFELRKWSSNCPEFLSTIPESDRELNSCFSSDANDTVKILGIKWCPSRDIFTYEVKQVAVTPTKRNILSHIAKIFDILGWIAPVVIYAKILIQRLWISGIDWDELPDSKFQEDWLRFTEELPQLSEIELPRFILSTDYTNISLHGFCDASISAYSAVIYLRVVQNDQLSIHLFIAKSRVAPLKTISLPKLELCGAVLLAKLLEYSKTIISTQTNTHIDTFAWSDSTIVLNWIHTSPHLLKTFVANRISVIQEKTNPSQWFHVPTDSNPADCASRGLYPRQLINHPLWWNSPDWLYETKEKWPVQNYVQVPLTQLPDVKQTLTSNLVNVDLSSNLSLLERFSNLNHLKRITAWCLRFANNCKLKPESRIYSELTVNELKAALNVWIKLTQNYYFSQDLHKIKSNLPPSGALLKLQAFIDKDGFLRVGGRLQNADLSYETKHPILLPQDAHLSRLIVDCYHQVYLHIGPRALQGILARRFWILSSRKLIRKRIFKCVKCTKLKASSPTPLMAPLPSYRLQRNRPFLQTGCDFAGPFSTKSHRGRKPSIYKSYLCLFVCMATRAVHLEAVSSLSTEDFLATFDRFIARRGICSDIFTDNGTMFVGASNYLKEVYNFLSENSDTIQRALSVKEIKWHFNPPSAPHFGGLWEAGVKSTKFHLKRIVGEQVLTFEEFSTLLCRIEAILNSRPLCTLSSDPSEVEILTPAHFLIGDSLLAVPEEDLTGTTLNRLSRWQLVQQTTQHFWHRWSTEYLHTLQQRGKWNKNIPNLKIGDIVVIKDSNLPPLRWPIGRIIELHSGNDGIARVATLITKFGHKTTRPVVKLCPLPTQDN